MNNSRSGSSSIVPKSLHGQVIHFDSVNETSYYLVSRRSISDQIFHSIDNTPTLLGVTEPSVIIATKMQVNGVSAAMRFVPPHLRGKWSRSLGRTAACDEAYDLPPENFETGDQQSQISRKPELTKYTPPHLRKAIFGKCFEQANVQEVGSHHDISKQDASSKDTSKEDTSKQDTPREGTSNIDASEQTVSTQTAQSIKNSVQVLSKEMLPKEVGSETAPLGKSTPQQEDSINVSSHNNARGQSFAMSQTRQSASTSRGKPYRNNVNGRRR